MSLTIEAEVKNDGPHLVKPLTSHDIINDIAAFTGMSAESITLKDFKEITQIGMYKITACVNYNHPPLEMEITVWVIALTNNEKMEWPADFRDCRNDTDLFTKMSKYLNDLNERMEGN